MYAYHTGADQTFTESGLTLTYNTVAIDTNSSLSGTTYTCTKAGIYLINVFGSCRKTSGTANGSDSIQIVIQKNGTNVQGDRAPSITAVSTEYAGFANGAMVSLDIGDTVTVSLAVVAGGDTYSGYVRGACLTISPV